MCCRGTKRRPVSESWKARWRWLKVPRLESWPLRWTGRTFEREGAEGQGLGESPVDRGAGVERCAARARRMHLKLRGSSSRRAAASSRRAHRLGFCRGSGFWRLALEGTPVRLSGQIPAAAPSANATSPSTIRKPATATSPCNTSRPDQARFDVFDSSSANTPCWVSSSATVWPIR